ncbi:5'-methylthioadenosine/adenosylhomocysteine nucleosidase [Enterococcus sp. LJL98]
MKIAIIAAMKEELAPFREYYASKVIFQKGKTIIEEVNDNLYLVESGIGKVNAAATSTWLCEKVRPDLIINTGSTGAFCKEVALGDFVCTDQFVYSDVDATGFSYDFGQVPQMPASYPVSPIFLTKIQQILEKSAVPVHVGTIATADSFMSDEERIESIRQKFPRLLASDMESCAIAQVASFYALPVINLRGVSDHVGSNAPETFEMSLALAAQRAFQGVKALIEEW